MRIAFVSYEYPPHNGVGGIAFYFFQLASLLKRKNSITVFSGFKFTSDEKYRITYSDGVTSVIVNCKNDIDFIDKVVSPFNLLHSITPFDLVESPEIGACALKIKLINPTVPLVVKFHTPKFLLGTIVLSNSNLKFKLRWFLKSLLRLDFNLVNKVFLSDCGSEYEITKLANLYYSPSSELYSEIKNIWFLKNSTDIIPNYYHFKFDNINNLISKKSISLSKKIEISFIGKLSFLKGADILFNLLKLLIKSEVDFHLNIIGDDQGDINETKYLKKYDKLIKSAKDDVFIHHRMNNHDLKDYYLKSHILIIPSMWENYPTVLLEGIEHGCLIIANCVGGMKNMIIHKVTGYLVNYNDPKLYLSYIKLIKKDNLKYINITSKAYDSFYNLMEPKLAYDRQIKLYNRLVSKKKVINNI